MNTTPRFLNRLVLAVVGLLLLTAGAAGLAVLTLPAAAARWGSTAPRIGERIERLRRDTTPGGQADTWLWLGLAAALLLLIVLLVLWIAAQGRGRTGVFASADGRAGSQAGGRGTSGGTTGSVVITAAAVEQVLRTALLERPDLAGASVSTWEIRGVPGLQVRVFPRKGVPPYVTAAEVSRLVGALDAVMGYRTPVLISIRSGARVRFTRAERVN